MPDGDAIAGARERADRLGRLRPRWSPRATGTRPNHASFAEQGGPWPPHCVQGTPRRGAAPVARPRQGRRRRRRRLRARARGLLRASRRPTSQALLRERRRRRAHGGRARHRLLRAAAPRSTRCARASAVTVDRGGIRGIDVEPGRLRARARRAAAPPGAAISSDRARPRRRCSTGTACVGAASDGARVLERDGVVARRRAGRARARGGQRRALPRRRTPSRRPTTSSPPAYAEIGAKWTVWVPPGDERGRARCSRARGHVLDAEPVAMARDARAGRDRAPGRRRAAGLDRRMATLAEVGPRSTTAPTRSAPTRSRARSGGCPTARAHVYLARDDGEPGRLPRRPSTTRATAEVQMVAVLPRGARPGHRRQAARARARRRRRARRDDLDADRHAARPPGLRARRLPAARAAVQMWERTPAAPRSDELDASPRT